MRSVLLGTLRTHTRRYVAAGLAVLIAVAFLVVTDVLGSASRNGLVAGLEVPYERADVVVTDLGGTDAAALVDRAREQGDRASVLGWTMQPVTEGDRLVGDQVDVGPLADDAALVWQDLREGRLPTGAGEAVADVNAAKSADVAVGDVLRVGSGRDAVETTVVGLVDTPSASVAASLYLPWDDVAGWVDDLYVDSVAYDGPGSADDPDPLIAALERATPGSVLTVDEFVADRSAELTAGVDVAAVMLTLFASLALFVALLVIANTFSILFAQRSRDLALVRCVGATRGQVRRAIRVEALVLGVAASLAGVGAGIAAGYGLVALANALTDRALLGDVEISAVWVGGAALLGVLATLVASWLPTRRVVRTSPLVALRPTEGVQARSAAGVVRIALGALCLTAGVVGLAAAIAAEVAVVMVVGGSLFFLGVLVLGPLLVPALIRLGGAAARWTGPAARLATANAVRHPKRTATTTAALLVGVTLTVAVLTGLASSREATASEMERQHPVDAALIAGTTPLDDDVLARVRATEDVAAATPVPGVVARLSDGIGALPALAEPADPGVLRAAEPAIGARQVLLPYEMVPDDGRVTVRVGGASVELRAVGTEGWGEAARVAPTTLARLTDEPVTQAIWVRAADGADPEDLTGDLTAIARPADAEVTSGLSRRAYVELQLDVLTGTVVALLGIAVVIALIGIANTLGLSVLERGREHALLRALGLTRRQLRWLLAAEGMLLSLVATVLGSAIGVLFAWVGVRTLVVPIIDGAGLVLPWWQLATVIVVSAVAGLLAAVLPARRAVRVAPAAGLALE
jgi:putative ABC transport system permease protein